MNTEMYTERVNELADEIDDRCELSNAVKQLIQAPYSINDHEDTFLYAVPMEYGGGTRLDPMDVLKYTPDPRIPQEAFEGDLIRAARIQLLNDLERAKRGEL